MRGSPPPLCNDMACVPPYHNLQQHTHKTGDRVRAVKGAEPEGIFDIG